MLIALLVFAVLVWTVGLLVLYLNFRSLPRVGPFPVPPVRSPSLSVVVPARNEERDVERCVRSLATQNYPSLEVIVVDDQSSDDTPRILAKLDRELPSLRVIEGSAPPDGWLGKPWALQQGALASRSELILFCDADVIYEPGALRRIVAGFLESEAEGVTVLPRLEMHGFWEHLLMVQLPFTAFTLIPLFLSGSIRSSWLAVGGGPGNLLRAKTWRRIGTHEALRSAVIDDIALMQLVRAKGGQTEMVIARELVSVRMYRGFREIFLGFSKNSFHALGGTLPRAFFGLAFLGVTQLLPFVVLIDALLRFPSAGELFLIHWLGIGASLEIVLARTLLFWRLQYRIDNAILGQPLMAAVWLAIMTWSIWKVGVRRQLRWRGRAYDAAAARFGR